LYIYLTFGDDAIKEDNSEGYIIIAEDLRGLSPRRIMEVNDIELTKNID